MPYVFLFVVDLKQLPKLMESLLSFLLYDLSMLLSMLYEPGPRSGSYRIVYGMRYIVDPKLYILLPFFMLRVLL